MTNAAGRGTVLVVDHAVPLFDRQAGDLTMFEYLRSLRQAGAKVVFRPNDGVVRQPHANVLQQMGVELQLTELGPWLESRHASLATVLLARPNVASDLIPVVRRTRDVRLAYYVHDLHHVRERRRYETTGDSQAHDESKRLEHVETSIFRSVDAVLTPSAAEAGVIRHLAPSADVYVVPGFVCRTSSRTSRPLANRRDLLFLGGFLHSPNLDAASYLVHNVMPLIWKDKPDVRLHIVGADPPPDVLRLGGDRVSVTGWVPRLGPYFEAARVSVNPIRFGAGVKGKIVASLEAGVPVVTTTVGAEGMDLRNGVEALIADEPADIALSVVKLLRDDKLARSLVEAGGAYCETRYGEDAVRWALVEALRLSGRNAENV